jgi:hypothetical protein
MPVPVPVPVAVLAEKTVHGVIQSPTSVEMRSPCVASPLLRGRVPQNAFQPTTIHSAILPGSYPIRGPMSFKMLTAAMLTDEPFATEVGKLRIQTWD